MTMKDLTTYFQRNSSFVPKHVEYEKSPSSSHESRKNDPVNQIYVTTSDEATLKYAPVRLRKIRKKNITAKNKDAKLLIADVTDNDDDIDQTIVRKKFENKVVFESEKCADLKNHVMNSSVVNSCNKYSASDTSEIRTLKEVLLEDCCQNSVNNGKNRSCKKSNKGNIVNKRRKTIDGNTSNSENTDSSESLFSFNVKCSHKTYGRSSRRIRESRDNSLFNYFKKADRTASETKTKIDDSPVNCLKRVEVEVQVHSPPKVRHKLNKSKETIKENMSPFLKIVRADVVKSINFDDIKVVHTEYLDISNVPSGDKRSTHEMWKIEPSEINKNSFSKNGDYEYKTVFRSKRSSLTLKNQNQSSDVEEKNFNFSKKALHKNLIEDDKNKQISKDTGVEKRILFKNINKSEKEKNDSQYYLDSDTVACSTSAWELNNCKIVEKKNTINSGMSSQSKSSGNDSDSSCKSSSKMQPWKMRVKFKKGGKSLSKKLNPKSKSDGEEQSSSAKETKMISSNELNKFECKTKNVNKPLHMKNEVVSAISTKKPVGCENITTLDVLSSTKKNLNRTDVSQETKKLAPLFCKQYHKGKKRSAEVIYDAIRSKAKRSFLDRGLPDTVKKKMEEEKSFGNVEDDKSAIYKFPKVTHVQQKTDSFVWNLLSTVDLFTKGEDESVIIPESGSFSVLTGKDMKLRMDSDDKCNFDLKHEVVALKKQEPDVSVGDICSSVKRLFKEAESANNNICWTDKYKPLHYEDLIGNATSLLRLKEWIESHKRLKSNVDGDSSSEEFIDSDDSCGTPSHNNIALLVGPPGCGKTCAVYMLANELGFKVLEVNAASNRNGKRLLDELLEATQSHTVKRSIFDKAEIKSAKKKKSKKNNANNREKKTMSLILIEDSDILFENHDDGYLSALSSLAARSKRPLVFTMNDINYPHLSKYNNARNLVIKFTYPSRSLINVWLQLIALIEGVKLSDEVLMDLSQIAGLDVRKSLLQLQMLISSRTCYSIMNNEQVFYNKWWKQIDYSKSDHIPVQKNVISETEVDLFGGEKANSSAEGNSAEFKIVPGISDISQRKVIQKTLEKHASFLKNVATLGFFQISQYQRTTSSIIDHSAHIIDENDFSSRMNCDITNFLKTELFSKLPDNSCSASFKSYYALIMKNSKIKSTSDSTLSYLKLVTEDSYAKYCDYLPAIRSIARIENKKQKHSVRRSNRYFGYLKSINIDISNAENEFLCKSLLVMCKKRKMVNRNRKIKVEWRTKLKRQLSRKPEKNKIMLLDSEK